MTGQDGTLTHLEQAKLDPTSGEQRPRIHPALARHEHQPRHVDACEARLGSVLLSQRRKEEARKGGEDEGEGHETRADRHGLEEGQEGYGGHDAREGLGRRQATGESSGEIERV